MIFASDLDRTLIFSESFLNELQDKVYETRGKIVEETKRGYGMIYEPMDIFLEYMNNSSLVFIPCTARTKEQYKRLNLRVKPKYAIVENGCMILDSYGEPVPEYDKFIRNSLGIRLEEETQYMLNEVEIVLNHYNMEGLAKVEQVKNSYVLVQPIYKNIGDLIEILDILNKHFQNLNLSDYSICVDKWKIYITHSEISKATALKWIADKIWEQNIIAAGDTSMDEEMLNMAEYAIIPAHATLSRKSIRSKKIEISSGMEGTKQMIIHILECLSEL